MLAPPHRLVCVQHKRRVCLSFQLIHLLKARYIYLFFLALPRSHPAYSRGADFLAPLHSVQQVSVCAAPHWESARVYLHRLLLNSFSFAFRKRR